MSNQLDTALSAIDRSMRNLENIFAIVPALREVHDIVEHAKAAQAMLTNLEQTKMQILADTESYQKRYDTLHGDLLQRMREESQHAEEEIAGIRQRVYEARGEEEHVKQELEHASTAHVTNVSRMENEIAGLVAKRDALLATIEDMKRKVGAV
jgi:predicted nuclease with TOPRIM domain